MTYRPSNMNNPCWLHDAAPAQACCANRSLEKICIATPPYEDVLPRRQGCDLLVSSVVKTAKRPAETTVASTVSALSP